MKITLTIQSSTSTKTWPIVINSARKWSGATKMDLSYWIRHLQLHDDETIQSISASDYEINTSVPSFYGIWIRIINIKPITKLTKDNLSHCVETSLFIIQKQTNKHNCSIESAKFTQTLNFVFSLVLKLCISNQIV